MHRFIQFSHFLSNVQGYKEGSVQKTKIYFAKIRSIHRGSMRLYLTQSANICVVAV